MEDPPQQIHQQQEGGQKDVLEHQEPQHQHRQEPQQKEPEEPQQQQQQQEQQQPQLPQLEQLQLENQRQNQGQSHQQPPTPTSATSPRPLPQQQQATNSPLSPPSSPAPSSSPGSPSPPRSPSPAIQSPPSSPRRVAPQASPAPVVAAPVPAPAAPAAQQQPVNNNFNVFVARHQVSVVVLKHQGISGRHPRDPGKFYYQARIRNEYPQRHIWSGWANRDEVVAKIAELLHATPDTKIETVPTQNPSRRASVDGSAGSSTRVAARRSSVTSSSTSGITAPVVTPRKRSISTKMEAPDFPFPPLKRTRTQQQPASRKETGPPASTIPPADSGHYSYAHHIASGSLPHLPLQLRGGVVPFSVPAAGQFHHHQSYQAMQHPPSGSQSVAPFHLLKPDTGHPTAHPIFPMGPTDPQHRRMSIDRLVNPSEQQQQQQPVSPTSPTTRKNEMESLLALACFERQQLACSHTE